MENENNVVNIDTEKTLNELKEKAKEDLKDAKFLEYAIPEEDAKLVNELTNRLENMKKEIESNKDKNLEIIEKFNKENKMLLDFFSSHVATVTDAELSALLKDNIEKLKTNIKTNTEMIERYNQKEKVLSDVLEILTYKINDENKAYVSDEIIKFARLMLTN